MTNTEKPPATQAARPLAGAQRTQAERIYAAFGGVPKLYKAMVAAHPDRDRPFDISSVYRWNLPRATGGTGGVVPTKRIAEIKRAARIEGIVIPDSAWCP